jgi:hypothetical protein
MGAIINTFYFRQESLSGICPVQLLGNWKQDQEEGKVLFNSLLPKNICERISGSEKEGWVTICK